MVRVARLLAVTGVVLGLAWPVRAANKEHLQMMADIRMLQEQAQQLQAHLIAITEALKAVASKLDEQAGVSRKAFADHRLLTDAISADLRVVREKVDDNNVRISSLAQEVEAVRLAIPPPGAVTGLPAAGEQPPDAATPPAGQPVAPPAGPVPGMSAQRMYDTAWADYAAGQYNLAVSEFEGYIRTFPKSDLAARAQYYIGESYYQQGKFREAVAAYDRGIADYPASKEIPDVYYKRGLALDALGQTDRARESWEFVVKNHPNSDAGRLAKQRLDQLSRRREQGDPPADVTARAGEAAPRAVFDTSHRKDARWEP